MCAKVGNFLYRTHNIDGVRMNDYDARIIGFALKKNDSKWVLKRDQQKTEVVSLPPDLPPGILFQFKHGILV